MALSNPALNLPESGPESDPQYESAQAALQQGRWAEAIQILNELVQRYPNNSQLKAQLGDARIKSSFEIHTPQVRAGRQVPRWLFLPVVVALVAAVLYSAWYIYQHEIVPYQARVAAVQKATQLLTQGQVALAHDNLDEAQRDFEQAHAALPADEIENPAINAGLAEVEKARGLAKRYDEAVHLMDSGQQVDGIAALQELDAAAPGYRDVAARLKMAKEKVSLEKAFAEAEDAYAGQRWKDAAVGYEVVRKIDGTYHKQEVASHIYDAYINQALSLVAVHPMAPTDVDEAINWANKALSVRPGDNKASTERKRLQGYLVGRTALNAGDMEKAIPALRTVYDSHPTYLGGLVAEQLYSAYLARGSQFEAKGDYTSAYIQYQVASRLVGIDTSEAQRRMALIAPLITPTATPTDTPTVTPTFTPTVTPLPSATPLPPTQPPPPTEPPPTPAPLDIAKMHNAIVFRSDRGEQAGAGGSAELWVMNTAGKVLGFTRDRKFYDQAYERGSHSPDNKAHVFNMDGVDGAPASPKVYIFRDDLPANWVRRFILVDSGKQDYDPVWSPRGDLIAFVSPRTGNDEIFTIPPYTNGQVTRDQIGLKQLTHNNWEWDKHPFFSPDGSKIIFWSNRVTGRKQIWLMNSDGSDQHPLSVSDANDWDPVWLP